MDIALKPESQRFVEGLVKEGQYPSPEDVVQAGLKLLQERQAQIDH